MSEHFVQFYEADEFLLDSVSGFIGAGLGHDGFDILLSAALHNGFFLLVVRSLIIFGRGGTVCMRRSTMQGRF